MPRWLLGLAALALASAGMVAVARDRAPKSPAVVQLPLSGERSVGPGTCSGLLIDVVNQLGVSPQPPAASNPTAQVRAIAAEVERIRGLEFRKKVNPSFVSQEEIRAMVSDSVKQGYSSERSEADTRVLVALGAIPPETDLAGLVGDILGEQVIGFYDSSTEKIVVGTTDPDLLLTPLARVALAHELDHALSDEALGIPEIALSPGPGEEDASIAALALTEGDASFVMQIYAVTSLSLEDRTKLLEDPAIAGAAAEDEKAPPYIRQALEFPYATGLGFTCDLYASGGGWTGVNSAYKDLPKTSAQIMFPGRYRAREAPIDAPDTPGPGEGWADGGYYAIGAADLAWLFDAPGGNETEGLSRPAARAADWAGGELRMWTRGPESAVGLSLVDRRDAGVLCVSVKDWYTRSFPKDVKLSPAPKEMLAVDGQRQDAILRCDERIVRLGIGPDLATARSQVQ